jgi:formate C-acetyltransferase
LNSLISTYFKKGGLHAGITVLNREQLTDAMEHPEKYPALTVRLYGFSEYFICMPRWQQEAILERTAY